jgi:hypothetical protein
MQPVTNVVKIQQRHIICASDGMNKSLQDEEVETGWSRGGSIWDNN